MSHWVEKEERSNLATIRLIVMLARSLGRRAGRALLYPITLYFVIFSRGGYRVSKEFLQRATNAEAGFRQVFQHYYAFASTLLDNVFISANRFDLFDIEICDNGWRKVIRADTNAGRGSIFLGAHLGSFYAMRLTGDKFNIPVAAMMYRAESSKIMQVLAEQAPSLKRNIIEITDRDAWIRAKSLLDEGISIAILADRSVSSDSNLQIDFLGKPASFPAGPVIISSLLKAPVYTIFTLYRGKALYQVHIHRLGESIRLDRTDRLESARPYVTRYVRLLEDHCRLAPYNWFNFYDFWATAKKPATADHE